MTPWEARWLEQGLSPRRTHTFLYQDAVGRDVVRKQRFALMKITDGSWHGKKTYLVSHRSVQSLVLGTDAWDPGVGEWGSGLMYNLPRVLASRVVWWCEGERDADAAAELGLVGTTHYQGSAGARADQAKVLLGCGDIRIVMDNDDVGVQIAWYHVRMLRDTVGYRGALSVWKPRDGFKDLQQVVAGKFGLSGLVRVGARSLASLSRTLGPLQTGAGPDYAAREIRDALASRRWTVKREGQVRGA